MPDITVDSADLEALVKLAMEQSIELRARKAIFLRGSYINQSLAGRYLQEVEEEIPKARLIVKARHADLLRALSSGSAVSGALKSC